mmetsp:Transcript_28447/g.88182  ORF Transcript_28447/g.88182 Transcript_28447/m.88182 type:complete len:184 (-) Transcript_28447:68-619(-)|eukprot:CAMPEP_0174830718 /NCGR_PEP_ID=MMETSP1114-20130205/2680_1 /TAXON_ID=312471 /ORGANISM="Neobodo designis, Strain CCAP 1951/1" /LENGTH=183 /DNA_ID=CAMNT_0016064521 /DNA_START=103 /DNA_END=654 /DNA_ORIENTATION=+
MAAQAWPQKLDFKQVASLFSADASRPDVVVFWATGAVAVIVLGLHWLDAIAGWVATMVVQMLQLLAGIYVLVTLQEYEDKMLREPADVQKVINPMRWCLTALRGLHLVQYLLLGAYFFGALFVLPVFGFDLSPFAHPAIESTRLWKECSTLKTEFKYRMIYDVTFFFVVMFFMLYNLIFHLER